MRIHFIAIGGTIMHSLALSMQKAGHEVSGSDDEIYEPSRSRLEQAGILPDKMGWYADRIHPGLDRIVLGMHARKDNPEMLRAMELGLMIESFPEFIAHLAASKTRIVVAGSHGKTTTAGMISHALHRLRIPADRMIGATIGDLPQMEISDAGIMVLEGDEYLSSPIDARAKFLHYHPHIIVITGIAWDHMNVFPTYDSYLAPFTELLYSLTPDACLVYCADDPELAKLVESVQPISRCIAYSANPSAYPDGKTIAYDSAGHTYPLQIFGQHNMQNLMAAKWVCQQLNVSEKDFYQAMASFTGASKRLELLGEFKKGIAYQDFAHAPSKVKATVHAVREKHPSSRIIACLELHTFSSLNPAFLPQYRHSLMEAAEKLVYYSPHTLDIKKLPPLSTGLLAEYFKDPQLKAVTKKEELIESLGVHHHHGHTVLLWMSSGRFDDLDLKAASEKYFGQ